MWTVSVEPQKQDIQRGYVGVVADFDDGLMQFKFRGTVKVDRTDEADFIALALASKAADDKKKADFLAMKTAIQEELNKAKASRAGGV
jgi:predicted component of type VI protein secretion system